MKMISFFLVLMLHMQAAALPITDTLVERPMILKTATGEIHGSLLMKQQQQKMPVVLLIAGSGPTDRNGNNPMMRNESLRLLARGLAEQGIASLRYDKRGIAESTPAATAEVDLRFEDYIQDAAAWIELLKKDQRFNRVIIIGHSEGSLIGAVAAKGKADAYISLAGPGRPAQLILKDQLQSQPQAIKDLAFPILDSLAAGKRVEQVNPMLFALFRPSVQPYMISWFRYDPAKIIGELKMPVMIIQGTKDIQVEVEEADILHRAQPAARKLVIRNMNHVLKIIQGNIQENIESYSNPELPVSRELVDEIVRFVDSSNK